MNISNPIQSLKEDQSVGSAEGSRSAAISAVQARRESTKDPTFAWDYDDVGPPLHHTSLISTYTGMQRTK